MEESKKPALRFKGFHDDWEQRKLGEVADVHSGKDYKHLSDGNIPVYGTGGYMLSVNEALSYDEDAIGIGRKGTIDKPYVLKAPFWTVDTLFYAVPREKIDLSFLYDIFQNIDWKKKDESTGVPSLSKTAINDIEILVSDYDEQQVIGAYFRSLDHLITLHQRKYESLVNIKKAMLEKMFPKNGEVVPELRFAGFTDTWEQRKLGELVDRVVRKNSNNESSLPLTISAQYGLVDQVTYFNNRVASRDVSNYYLILNGEFAYNKSTSDGFPFGAVKRLDLYEKGVLSTLYIIFGIRNTEETNSDFLTVFFDTNRWHKGVAERAAEGARNHGLLNISAEDFFEIDLFLPKSEKEQATIGAYMRSLDHLITLHQRELEKLQNIKKSCLEKMFI